MVEHTRPTNTGQRTSRARPLALVATVVLCGLAAAGAVTRARAADREQAAEQRSADGIEMIQLRSELRRVHLAETNLLMLQLIDGVEDVAPDGELDARLETARDERSSARERAVNRLAEIIGHGGSTAAEALFLRDLLTSDGLADVREADPSVLFDTGRAAARDSRPPVEQSTEEELALYDLMRTDAAGAQVFNDAMDAAYTLLQPEPPELMADYVSGSEPYIRSEGGYLGPDETQPLLDSYVYDQTAATPLPEVAVVSDRIVASRLWTYDQWIVSWQDGTPGPAPLGLDELDDEVTSVQADLRRIIDPRLASALDVHRAAADRAHQYELQWWAAAVLLGAAALVALIVLAISRWRAVHRQVARSATDPLTGVGNRHQLDRQVATDLANPVYGWHLVAAIDMDRFKMINDTWGHQVGDRVLVEVARRLSAVVDGWRGSAAGIAGQVVRMGGDEFLLALHAKTPINEAIVRQQLDDVRQSSIRVAGGDTEGDAGDERVQLMYSVGVAVATGPVELDDLVRTADLASYEEKAERSRHLVDRRRSQPHEARGASPQHSAVD
jgi:diguanylate cyclase (GGDEF)-like protein